MRPGVRRDVLRMLRYAPAVVAAGFGFLLALRLTALGMSEKIGGAAVLLVLIFFQAVINHYTAAEQAEREAAQHRGERPEDSYLPWYGVVATIIIMALLLTGCLWLGFLTQPAGS